MQTTSKYAVVGLAAAGLACYSYSGQTEISSASMTFTAIDADDEAFDMYKEVLPQEEQIEEVHQSKSFFATDEEPEVTMWKTGRDTARFKRVVVGEAMAPHRTMINHKGRPQSYWNNPKNSMNFVGWKHLHSFIAFNWGGAGLKRVVVGQANPPHRALLNHPSQNQAYWNNRAHTMNYAGWKHYYEFYAFSTKQPGTVRFAVGQAQNPHRMMINHHNKVQAYWNNPKKLMNYAGWAHYYEFWAYPKDLKLGELQYHYDEARLVSRTVKPVGQKTYSNFTPNEQHYELTVTYDETHAGTFSHKLNVPIPATGSSKVASPAFKGKLLTDLKASKNNTQDFTLTTPQTKTVAKEVHYTVKVPAKVTATVKCQLYENKVTVPYSISLTSKWGLAQDTIDGLWTGNEVANLNCFIEQ